jgi:predicted component of type VI protein secretion system
MKFHLVVTTPGKGEGKIIPITLSQFLIGRDPQCHLRPASAIISKRHCALMARGEQAFLRDFDSTNGTFLNEKEVKGEVELHHGDQLRVGPLLFRVHLETSVPVDKATPIPPTKTPVPPTKAPVGGKTPPPATKAPGAQAPAASAPADETVVKAASAPQASGEPSNDDDIAQMLLSLQDDGGTGTGAIGADGVPEGSTVMDVPSPFTEGEPGKETGKDKKDKKPGASGNTSTAAKAILEKYMKRPRT